jgi:hypothetical protein
MDIILLVVVKTNKYCNQYLDTLHNENRCSQLPDMTVQEMQIFLAHIIQMGHDEWDILKGYWSTLEQFYSPFYSNMMNCD